MRKSFQAEWLGIRFSDFAVTSSSTLAGPEFYEAFYRALFACYAGWTQLPPEWLKHKELWARFVMGRNPAGGKILSVGCGLGAVEHAARSLDPQADLSIHEVAPSAWRWIGSEFASDRKFIGMIPACLPKDARFDLVYLATVDYALDDDALIALLSSLRLFLTEKGRCLVISASFQEAPATLFGGLKSFAAAALDACGLRSRGQFWGWVRTQAEYQSLMRRAGYRDVEDGFIDSEKREDYWIEGR